MGDGMKTRRKPNLRDVIGDRPKKVLIDVIKDGPARKQPSRAPGKSIACSFTMTVEIDAEIQRIANHMNCSRSRVVRQAVILYGEPKRGAAEE